MYNPPSNPIMTAYFMDQPPLIDQCTYGHDIINITSFDEQELLLTSGFYPTFTTSMTAAAEDQSYPSMSEYASSSSSSSSSPDTFSYQYKYFPSPSPTTEPTTFDFFPFLQQHEDNRSPILTTAMTEENTRYQNDTTIKSPKPMTSHSMEGRPYPCHLCKRAFARKHDLQRHIRVHTGDKPYVCACCKKSFARTDALKRHLRMEEQCRSSQEVLQSMKTLGKRKLKHL